MRPRSGSDGTRWPRFCSRGFPGLTRLRFARCSVRFRRQVFLKQKTHARVDRSLTIRTTRLMRVHMTARRASRRSTERSRRVHPRPEPPLPRRRRCAAAGSRAADRRRHRPSVRKTVQMRRTSRGTHAELRLDGCRISRVTGARCAGPVSCCTGIQTARRPLLAEASTAHIFGAKINKNKYQFKQSDVASRGRHTHRKERQVILLSVN